MGFDLIHVDQALDQGPQAVLLEIELRHEITCLFDHQHCPGVDPPGGRPNWGSPSRYYAASNIALGLPQFAVAIIVILETCSFAIVPRNRRGWRAKVFPRSSAS